MNKNELIQQHGNLLGQVLDKQGLERNEYNLDKITRLVRNNDKPEEALKELLKR